MYVCVWVCSVRVCVCFKSLKKLKPAGKNNKTAKDEQLGQTSQFSFNSSCLGYVRMLHDSHDTLISLLVNSSDYLINCQLVSFISQCFELRTKLISMNE